MKIAALSLLLSATAFCQTPAPLVFPPGATLEQKKAMIVQRMADQRAQQAAAAADKTAREQRATQMADNDPGPKPAQNEDGSVPVIIQALSANLKDPSSLQTYGWRIDKGINTNGQAIWNVVFFYNAKNSYGGYVGYKPMLYVFRNGENVSSQEMTH